MERLVDFSADKAKISITSIRFPLLTATIESDTQDARCDTLILLESANKNTRGTRKCC